MISVVIPTLNEAATIEATILATRSIGDCQIVVVDGGSQDGTRERAQLAEIVLSAEPGRARQQNSGAKTSCGEILLFLHADCRLGPESFDDIREALQDERVVGGCFQQRIDSNRRIYRWIEWGNGLRVRLFKMAYGDQAIFVRKKVFERLGGFPDVEFMEDVLFMKKLRREGRFVLIPNRLLVSARRWERYGIIRQTLRNWILLTLAVCGVSPNRLARFYSSHKEE